MLADKDMYDATGGGVTVSGGEPLLWPEFCRELFGILKNHGVNTALDTSLYAPWEKIEPLLPLTDTFLVDLKAPDAATHRLLTGVGNVKVVFSPEIPVVRRRPPASMVFCPAVAGLLTANEVVKDIIG